MRREVFSNRKEAIVLAYAVLLLNCLVAIECIQTETHEYPMADEYFDRIYRIEDSEGDKFLHIHCKEPNMISLSITKEIQYEEHPRFPTYPSWKQTPNFQRKFYTFFDSCGLDIVINNKQSLIELKRKSDGVSIFKLNSYSFKQVDHIEINTSDNSKKWGLGERFQKHFAVKDGSWTIWNRDRPWEIDQGSPLSSKQTYGHQPVYLARENEGQHKYHLVYFKNTYGMNVDVSNNANNLKYSVVGGNIQFIILIGQNPEAVLEQYHKYIGPAHVPPFWSLGYHQSRWGYKTYEQFSGVVDEFDQNKLPLDTMWSDLDYMNAKAIFTVDEKRYPSRKMKNLIENKQIHYIPLIDVGVSLDDKVAMEKGKASDVFLKSPSLHNSNYVATVWPGKVHFVDYLHPNASEYWESQLDRLYQLIPFSGVWLDMNEPSNFQGNEHVYESYPIQRRESINMMTINVDIEHYSPTDEALKERQVHAYYGHFSTIPTHHFLKKHGRPFIISRSNSVGTGAYAGHWTGDNVATWDFLRLSISGNFLFQIFGIQMVGADICGFHQNTNEELCSRWMQVGSFYPFARNHNENQSISQQPYRFGNDLLETTRNSFNQRYSLLKQMYSTLVLLNGTGSYYRPMFFEFDQDEKAVQDQESETQFMIGSYLMGAPIVESGKRNRDVYFPGNQKWYQLQFRPDTGFNHNEPARIYKGGETKNVANTLPSAPPTFLRAGKLLFTTAPQLRTKNLDSKFTLYAALLRGKAEGDILGINDYSNQTQISGCLTQGCKLHVSVEKKNNEKCVLNWDYEGQFPYRANLVIENLRVFDQQDQFSSLGSAITISKPSGSQEFKIRLI